MERESQSGRVVKQKHWFFWSLLIPFFLCQVSMTLAAGRNGSTMWGPGVLEWMWQAARSDWCSSEERKPRNTGKTNNERKKRSNSHDFASICINFASFFHLYLSSSLLSSPSSLVMQISFDTYHYSLFGNPPHAKRTSFISTHQPSHPKYGISQAALDLTH